MRSVAGGVLILRYCWGGLLLLSGFSVSSVRNIPELLLPGCGIFGNSRSLRAEYSGIPASSVRNIRGLPLLACGIFRNSCFLRAEYSGTPASCVQKAYTAQTADRDTAETTDSADTTERVQWGGCHLECCGRHVEGACSAGRGHPTQPAQARGRGPGRDCTENTTF